jgi:hypothetical protein
VFPFGEVGLGFAHLPQHGSDSLLGLDFLTLPFSLLALQALHRCQKPLRFWLAI